METRLAVLVVTKEWPVASVGLGLRLPSPVVPNVSSSDVGLGKEFAVTF
jgi:hypothetical protein